MSRNFSGNRVFTTLGLCALLLAAPMASQVPEKALECNSDIALSFTSMNAMPGMTVGVEMEVVNGPSNDVLDNPVAQDVTQITYYPDCLTITAGFPPTCTVNPTPDLSFAALTSNTCGTMVNDAVQPDGSVVFTFTPSPLTLAAAAVGPGTSTCSIFFDVNIAPAAMVGGTLDSLAVSAVNNCVGTGLTSQASGTANLTIVPTMGGVALVVLALTLIAGAWWLLRRRSAVGALGV